LRIAIEQKAMHRYYLNDHQNALHCCYTNG